MSVEEGKCPKCDSLDTGVWSFNGETVSYQCNECRHRWVGPRESLGEKSHEDPSQVRSPKSLRAHDRKKTNELLQQGITLGRQASQLSKKQKKKARLLEEALRCFNEALEFDPENAIAWTFKGTALAEMEKLTEALKCFERACELVPGYPDAWYKRGICLQDLGRYRDSIECFDRVIHFPPYNGEWRNKDAWMPWEAMAFSYDKLFLFGRSVELLKEAQSNFQELGLPVRKRIKASFDRAKFMHDSLRSPGTNLEEARRVHAKSIRKAIYLARVAKYEEAIDSLREHTKSDLTPEVLYALGTLMITSVPYRTSPALQAQGISSENRKLRFLEAKRILERVSSMVDRSNSLAGMALNNEAVALVHLADYSETWDDLLSKHQKALETIRHVVNSYPNLKTPKVNLAELTICLRTLEIECKRQPDLVEDWMQRIGVSPEEGTYLTDLRDVIRVARSDEARVEILEELKTVTSDPEELSMLQQHVERLRDSLKKRTQPQKKSRWKFW